MLSDTQERTAGRSWIRVYHSRAGEGTKVSIHALQLFLCLIT